MIDRHRRTGSVRQGTLGKRLATHYGLRHLDTGLIYRAVARAVLQAGRPRERPGGGDFVRKVAARPDMKSRCKI